MIPNNSVKAMKASKSKFKTKLRNKIKNKFIFKSHTPMLKTWHAIAHNKISMHSYVLTATRV